jgi:hypothetical protein
MLGLAFLIFTNYKAQLGQGLQNSLSVILYMRDF